VELSDGGQRAAGPVGSVLEDVIDPSEGSQDDGVYHNKSALSTS
jgi:hypothetical protein